MNLGEHWWKTSGDKIPLGRKIERQQTNVQGGGEPENQKINLNTNQSSKRNFYYLVPIPCACSVSTYCSTAGPALPWPRTKNPRSQQPRAK